VGTNGCLKVKRVAAAVAVILSIGLSYGQWTRDATNKLTRLQYNLRTPDLGQKPVG
jgi:hypothetical protein